MDWQGAALYRRCHSRDSAGNRDYRYRCTGCKGDYRRCRCRRCLGRRYGGDGCDGQGDCRSRNSGRLSGLYGIQCQQAV